MKLSNGVAFEEAKESLRTTHFIQLTHKFTFYTPVQDGTFYRNHHGDWTMTLTDFKFAPSLRWGEVHRTKTITPSG